MTSTHYERKLCEKRGFFCCCLVSMIVCILLTYAYFDGFLDTESNSNNTIPLNTSIYKTKTKTHCIYKNIIVPETIPCFTNKINKGWDICRCGARCTSWSPILSYSLDVFNSSSFSWFSLNYNVSNKICDISSKFSREYFEDIIEKYNRTKENLLNKTIDCFIDEQTNRINVIENTSFIKIINKKKEKYNETDEETDEDIDLEYLFESPIAILLILINLIILCCCLYTTYSCLC